MCFVLVFGSGLILGIGGQISNLWFFLQVIYFCWRFEIFCTFFGQCINVCCGFVRRTQLCLACLDQMCVLKVTKRCLWDTWLGSGTWIYKGQKLTDQVSSALIYQKWNILNWHAVREQEVFFGNSSCPALQTRNQISITVQNLQAL